MRLHVSLSHSVPALSGSSTAKLWRCMRREGRAQAEGAERRALIQHLTRKMPSPGKARRHQ